MESQATERMVQPLEIGFFVMAARSARGHGPGLQAESPGAGQGSTFAVESSRSPVKGIRVLIVEDDEDARALVTKVLESQGARFQLHRN